MMLQERIRKIDGLVTQLQNAGDPVVRASVLELVQTVMEFHARAIDRMMEIIASSGDAGWTMIETFTRDELVNSMLLLHGLHPEDLDTRVRTALETVRPYLKSHGGNVELVEIADGVVRLQMMGSCNGCPSSAVTLKTAIEKAVLEAAPDVASIECQAASSAA
jgi:Fe-S cluster biogenesis protein NfuA